MYVPVSEACPGAVEGAASRSHPSLPTLGRRRTQSNDEATVAPGGLKPSWPRTSSRMHGFPERPLSPDSFESSRTALDASQERALHTGGSVRPGGPQDRPALPAARACWREQPPDSPRRQQPGTVLDPASEEHPARAWTGPNETTFSVACANP